MQRGRGRRGARQDGREEDARGRRHRPAGHGQEPGAARYRDAWDWISVSDRPVQVHVDASRSRAAFQGHMPERTDDPTAHDGYVVYAVCRVGQEGDPQDPGRKARRQEGQ